MQVLRGWDPAVKRCGHAGNKRQNCNREFQVRNKFFKSNQQQGLSDMGVVCVLPSLDICGIWLDITYLEQPGATCPVGQPVFSSSHETGYPLADFQRCWCQTFIKKRTNFSQPPAPSLVVLFHPELLAAGCGKGTTSRASLGSVALHAHICWLLFATFMPVSVPRPSSGPEKEVASYWE